MYAENRGFEGSVTWNKTLTPDLAVSFTGNFTYNKNKLVNGDELNYRYPWQFSTGLPLNYTRGYVAEGYFRSEEEIAKSPVQNLGSQVKVGDIRYRDLNGDGQINQVIVSPIARPMPRTIPAITPDFAAGSTTKNKLLSLVAPRANEPS